MDGTRVRRAGLTLALLVTAITVLTATPVLARGSTTYSWYCGSYASWTDSYSGDVVHFQACIRIDGNGNVSTGSHSYVTSYNSSRPVNLWHVSVQLYDRTGAWKDSNSCDRSSAPMGSSNTAVCTTSSYNITASGSIAKTVVCLFYTSGQSNCTPWTSYTKS